MRKKQKIVLFSYLVYIIKFFRLQKYENICKNANYFVILYAILFVKVQMYMFRYKNCLLAAAFLCIAVSLYAADPASKNPAYEAYIARWRKTALAQQKQYGIPAAITLAQGLLESGAGQSALATEANNHFGIKCHQDWQGGTFHKDDDKKDECFRAYERAEDSFRDHSLFLKRKRYEVLFTYPITDYKAWANGLKACGYATDPGYPQKLIRIIETYDLMNIEKQKPEPAVEEPAAPAKPSKLAAAQPAAPAKPATQAKPTKPATAKPGKPAKPTKPATAKPDKPARPTTAKPAEPKQEQEQAFVLPPKPEVQEDTVKWTPAQMRTKNLYVDRAVGRTNGRKFIVAVQGDTWGSIAYLLGMEEKTLRRINEAADKQPLRGGDRIYLFPKRSKADKKHTRHLVRKGETAWDIAQRYGMRMSTLYKLNGIPEGTPLTTEQWLDLR